MAAATNMSAVTLTTTGLTTIFAATAAGAVSLRVTFCNTGAATTTVLVTADAGYLCTGRTLLPQGSVATWLSPDQPAPHMLVLDGLVVGPSQIVYAQLSTATTVTVLVQSVNLS